MFALSQSLDATEIVGVTENVRIPPPLVGVVVVESLSRV